MSRVKFPRIEGINQFRQYLLSSLSKLQDSSTLKTGQDEIQCLMQEHITNLERMNLFIYHVSDFNQGMKQAQKREHIKILGLAAEQFGSRMIQFNPKLIAFLQKRIKDSDQTLHPTIAETFGVIVKHTLRDLSETEDVIENLNTFLKPLFHAIVQGNKVQQELAALALGKCL